MVHPKQIRHLARSPAAYARYMATGKLPAMVKPSGPLIELLSAIGPRDLAEIRGLTVDHRLGYQGQRTFPSALLALHWAAPAPEMLEAQSWPAQSWLDRSFTRKLYLGDVLACAGGWPEHLPRRYPHLRSPAARAQPTRDAGDDGQPEAPAPRG